jgi:cysteine desulfurase/selenocysteine lyase
MPKWRLPLEIEDAGQHRRWALRNFPGLKGLTYLNSAGFTPLPAVTISRMKREFERTFEQMYEGLDEDASLAEFSKESSSLIGSKREEIAFVTSTTAGISLFANSVDWKRGDNIVIADIEYPSNILPWIKAACPKGVKIKVVRSTNGLVPIESIERQVDSRTKVLPVSLVEFASGQRFDVKRLAEICEKNGTILFLDAIQALGAVKVNVGKTDIAGLSAGGYKWLCGPLGSGILYVSSDHIKDLSPTNAHWRSIERRQQKELWSRVVTGGSLSVSAVRTRKGSSAYEFATEEVIQMAGLSESLKLLNSIGITRIEERIARLNDHLLGNLMASGFNVITPSAREERAGILSFSARRKIGTVKESLAIAKELGKVKLAIRGGVFRSAAHFFNTKQDLEIALERLTAVCRKRRLL